MGRWLLYLVLVMSIARLVIPSGFANSCIEQCDDDNDDRDCAPTCDDCQCCARVSVVAPALQLRPTRVLTQAATIAAAPTLPPSVDPRELLDVPKAVLV